MLAQNSPFSNAVLDLRICDRKMIGSSFVCPIREGDSEGNMPAKGVTRVFLPPLGPKPMEDVEVGRRV